MAYYIEVLVLLVIAAFLFHKWILSKYAILAKRGIPHDKPNLFSGNFELDVLFGKRSFLRSILDRYERFKGNKIYGVYSFGDIIIFLHDVELVKKIGIKDFEHFPNHRSPFTENKDSVFAKSLIALKDRKWKEMRNTLTPTFTGSKMRLMFDLINEICLEGMKYLESEVKATEKCELSIEMKEFFTRFANDVIATTAFGIKVNSFKDKTNEFYTIGKSVTNFKSSLVLKAVLIQIMPRVMKALGIKLMDETLIKYFNSLVLDAMKYRQAHNIIRPDMIHLLTEAKKQFDALRENSKEDEIMDHQIFNDEDLVAQCLLFFFAGFETVSSCLALTSYELLKNPEVQERLYEEIVEVEKELDGKPLNYDTIMKMKYMDMVFSESLRLWPPAIVTDRVCTSDYTLTDDDGNVVVEIKKGDQIFIPMIAYARDEKYFPDPEKFDPERFSDERKHEINPFAYVPFGVGPRNCIGNRFALMEIKSIVYHMLLKFKLVADEKTVDDMMSAIKGFQMAPKDGFWLKLIPREA